MPEQKFWRKFNKLMDQYIRYNGKWHNADCDFIHHDQGVCNCYTGKNNFRIKTEILSILRCTEPESNGPIIAGRAKTIGTIAKDKKGNIHFLTTS